LKLIITKPAQKDLAKLDKTTQKQIALVLDKYIAGEQVDILKLSGIPNRYRIRSGDYRIIVELVAENTILAYVLRVLKRKDAYR
jgi:mRNA-degrading endonuclease RelE of RelBE toxin-antitoxin system